MSVMLIFKVLSDRLTTEAYGVLQGALAVALIAGPLSTFGANWTVTRRGVLVSDLRVELGRAISLAGVGTAIGAALMVAVVPVFLPEVPLGVLIPVMVAQMPLFWISELALTAAVAQAKLKLTAKLRLVSGVIRIGALLAWVLYESSAAPPGDVLTSENVYQSLRTWVWFFLVGNLVSAVVLHTVLAKSLGGWPRLRRPEVKEFREGAPYGVGNTTEGFLSYLDRLVLVGYSEAQNGIYSAGYRIITLGLVPMTALLKAQDRRFFRQGAKGPLAMHTAAKSMALHSLLATVPVAIGLAALSPLMTVVISDDFAEAESVIRWLAILPIIKGFQFSFGNALSGGGHQTSRVVLTATVAVANLVANIVTVPLFGWQAAAVTTLIGEALLALGLATVSRNRAQQQYGSRLGEPASVDSVPRPDWQRGGMGSGLGWTRD
jgi:O-antigen/teichoic acid export membrane protein